MRKKIEELRNREEGFTLVELLAVIVILGIIVAIAIPAIGNTISTADTEAQDAENALILDAARLYYTTGEADSGVTVKNPVTVGDLIEAGYLDTRDSTIEEDTKVYRHPNGSVSFDESTDDESTGTGTGTGV